MLRLFFTAVVYALALLPAGRRRQAADPVEFERGVLSLFAGLSGDDAAAPGSQ
jgi:hypothetical protein